MFYAIVSLATVFRSGIRAIVSLALAKVADGAVWGRIVARHAWVVGFALLESGIRALVADGPVRPERTASKTLSRERTVLRSSACSLFPHWTNPVLCLGEAAIK